MFSIEKINCFVNNRPVACLLLILALSFTLRISRCFLVGRVDKDSVMYMAIADGLLNNDFKQAFELNPRIPPLYIFGIAAGEKAGLGSRAAGMFVSVISGALLPLAIFIAALQVFKSGKLALLSALMATVHPFFIRMSADIMRDSLFMSTFAFSLAFAVCGAVDRRIFSWHWTVSGFFAGLAAMTRSEGVEVFFAIIIWFAVEAALKFRKRNELSRIVVRAIVSVMLFVTVFVATTLPVEFAMRGSSSEWSAMDKRVVGYLKDFFEIRKDVILRGKGEPE